MPIETLGPDKEQHEALYQQARACVREGKPLRAVALLTQIIKYDPTQPSLISTAAAHRQAPAKLRSP